jgi:solute carrier family 25 carnitine/acylcarnitine transporter 20/29
MSSGGGDAAGKQRSSAMLGTKHPLLEALYGSLSGMAFGLLSPLASQPFDTIKTKMQAEARYAKTGPVGVGREILRTEGLKGFYRGMVPILLSTGVQKSALFAGYAGARRLCDRSEIRVLTAPLPFMNGMSMSVIVGSVAASTARTIVETPFELAKVRSQTGGR